MLLKPAFIFTANITVAIWALLFWDHFHGGVPGHHIFARDDLPEISNWWGGILLPALTLFLSYRVEKRLTNQQEGQSHLTTNPNNVLIGFFASSLYGIVLSSFFSLGNTEIPGYLLLGILVISLFYPIYRAECILGFVIGMTYTFGAVLPTGISSILALIGAVIYLFIRPIIFFLFSKKKLAGSKEK